MTYLLLSNLALLAGPFLIALASRRPAARDGLEGFILITLAGIICLHIAPEAWRVAGFAAVVTGLLGLVFPALLESLFRSALSRAHLVVLALAATGIVVHAVLDGIALLPLVSGAGLEHAGTAGSENRALAIGVIIHRLPVGMAIWWVLRPQFGTTIAVATFAVVIITTVFGYLLGEEVFAAADWSLALFQAFVAGSLVHVALFGASHDQDQHHGHQHGQAHGETDAEQAGSRTAGKAAGFAADAAAKVRARTVQSRAYRAGLLLGLVTIFILPHISS